MTGVPIQYQYIADNTGGKQKADCCSLDNLFPSKWNADCIAKTAITIFVVSLLLLTVSSLSHHYPAASGAFLTMFALATGVSLLVFIVALVKCKRQSHSEEHLEQINALTPKTPTPPTGQQTPSKTDLRTSQPSSSSSSNTSTRSNAESARNELFPENGSKNPFESDKKDK